MSDPMGGTGRTAPRALWTEGCKLFAIHALWWRQHARLLYRYRRASAFFTQLHILALQDRSAIPIKELGELYPGCAALRVQLYSNFAAAAEGFGGMAALVSPRELMVLCSIAKHLGARRVFEFGTHKGVTAYNLYTNLAPGAELTTVDRLAVGDDDPRLADFWSTPGVRRVTADSTRLDVSAWANAIDLVFIDGSHDEAVVLSDTAKALTMLRRGGVVLWHDYSVEHPGVYRAVSRLARELAIDKIAGTHLAHHRKL